MGGGVIRTAEKALQCEASASTVAEGIEDRLGVTVRFLRASEAESPDRISECIRRYPLLKDLVVNPYDFSTPVGPRLRRIRDHIVELSTEQTTEELTSLRADLRDGDVRCW